MDNIWEYIKAHEWLQGLLGGLAAGLIMAALIWKSGFSARRRLSKDARKLENELRELQGHLNTQLKINAQGNDNLLKENEEMRRQNENLRVAAASMQGKPGRAELRQYQITETAVRLMREQAPGFAPAWEKAMRQAETEVEATESGLKKLVRRVVPSIGMGGQASSSPSPSVHDAEPS